MLTVELPPEIEDRLAALSRRTGRPPAGHALEAVLDHLEDREDGVLARDRLESLGKGFTDTVPLEQLLFRNPR